jgi:large subunit ribosomal protein L33
LTSPVGGLRVADLSVVSDFAALNPGYNALREQSRSGMAKATTIKVKLVSSADTGFYYVTRKNSRTMTDKLVKRKYDPVAKKHVEFREAKIK